VNVQIYKSSLEGANNSERHLICNINLRRVLFVPGSLAIITPTVTAVARVLLSRIARFFIASRGFRRHSALSATFFLDQLREVVEQNVRKVKKQKVSRTNSGGEIVQKFT
jgi:inactivated superfamily I helicase